ncbi:MAG TPA: hypothetical protein VKA30_09930 [Actinomycetota bacterium]|nr:hypothetical protein [Actinomycetota bacterium]
MSDLIVSVDWSDITPGRMDEVKATVDEMVAFVETNESRPLAYQVFLDDASGRMTVFQMHPDSASMEEHMRVGAAVFGKFRDLLTLREIDIYGSPSPELLHALRAKADLLGGARLNVHELHGGFTRFGAD